MRRSFEIVKKPYCTTTPPPHTHTIGYPEPPTHRYSALKRMYCVLNRPYEIVNGPFGILIGFCCLRIIRNCRRTYMTSPDRWEPVLDQPMTILSEKNGKCDILKSTVPYREEATGLAFLYCYCFYEYLFSALTKVVRFCVRSPNS